MPGSYGRSAPQRSAHRLINGTLRQGVEWLGREGALIRPEGEGAMQFARALSEQFRFLGIDAADQLIEQCAGRCGLILQIGFAAEHPLVIAADRIERQCPAVALTCDCTLQKTNDGRFSFPAAIFDRATERGHVRKAALGKESRNFDIRIHTVLELAIKLQEKFVLKKHRGVALLPSEHLRGGKLRADILHTGVAGHADKLSIFSPGPLSIQHESKKLFAKRRVPNRVEQNRFFGAGETRDDCLRRRPRNGTRGVARAYLHRQSVCLRRAVGMTDLDKPKARRFVFGRNRNLLDNLYSADIARFGAKPPASADIIGQNFALELRPLTIGKQRLQIGRRIDRGHDPLFRRAAGLRLRLQHKPVMRVRIERQEERRLPDRGKKIAAKNFHRDAAGEGGQVDLG